MPCQDARVSHVKSDSKPGDIEGSSLANRGTHLGTSETTVVQTAEPRTEDGRMASLWEFGKQMHPVVYVALRNRKSGDLVRFGEGALSSSNYENRRYPAALRGDTQSRSGVASPERVAVIRGWLPGCVAFL